ncbi:MAG TPA: hypothetical protein VFC19_47625 [Candidatus Limnocylindrales bacterium]|nr:hypothetical protein [Candidatus Limnocylindrales bacterium]
MSTRHAGPDIGIVTALPIECFSLLAIINDLHVAPDPGGGDWYTYYLGTVPSRDADRPHQVVLCLLIDDGGPAAAHACANLVRTWGVRHIIMTGVACGVPNPTTPERHVRLGDILVADEGVIPYGHVRVELDCDQLREELRRPASRPSVVMRNAARRLRLAEEAGHRPWDRWLSISHRPRLSHYARPPASTDILFDDLKRQEVPHPPPRRSRQTRPTRTAATTAPVHRPTTSPPRPRRFPPGPSRPPTEESWRWLGYSVTTRMAPRSTRSPKPPATSTARWRCDRRLQRFAANHRLPISF